MDAHLTCSLIQILKRILTGHREHNHIPTWRRCRPSSPGSASQQLSTHLPPLLTPSTCRGSSCKPTLLCRIILKLRLHPPLRMIVSGTAGTGKSYLIHCLRLLLGNRVCVAAPTGVAAFNIEGHTLHSLLSLPVKGDYKDLEGECLHQLQQSLAGVDYLIIDEMSMVGRKIFGQVGQASSPGVSPSC